MNQIMPVGKGFLLALGDERVRPEVHERIREAWNEHFPEIPIFVIGPLQIVQRGEELLVFEFTGNISPTMVAEFQRWWEEVNNSG